MTTGKIKSLQDTFCDDVKIGQIGIDQHGRFVGVYLDGETVDVGHNRPAVYRTLRKFAYQSGLLVRVRKGVYRASQA